MCSSLLLLRAGGWLADSRFKKQYGVIVEANEIITYKYIRGWSLVHSLARRSRRVQRWYKGEG